MVFERYLLKNLITATLFMAVVLALIIFLTQSLRFLELVIEAGASSISFWVLTTLAMPRFFEIVLPFALMAAILFTYNKLTADSELLVMRGAGYSPMKLARPALTLSVLVTVFLLFVTTWLSPVSLTQMQQMSQAIKSSFSALLIKEGVFNQIGDHLTVYIENRRDDGSMEGLMIHDTNPDWEQPVTILAQEGVIVTDSKTQQVIVYNGSRQDFNRENGALNRLDFERYTIDLPDDKMHSKRWQEPDERTFWQLFNPSEIEARNPQILKNFRNEAHRRIIGPFLAPAYALIALMFLLLGPFNRRGQAMRITGAVLSVVIVQALYLSFFNLSGKTSVGLVMMYVLVLCPIGLGLLLLSPLRERIFSKRTPLHVREVS